MGVFAGFELLNLCNIFVDVTETFPIKRRVKAVIRHESHDARPKLPQVAGPDDMSVK